MTAAMTMTMMNLKIIPRWSLILIITFNLFMYTNGFNVKRSSSSSSQHQHGKSSAPTSSSSSKYPSNGGQQNLYGKSNAGESDSSVDGGDSGSSPNWRGKQYMDSNIDHIDLKANDDDQNPVSGHGHQGNKGDLTDAEFQQARDWKGFVDDWEKKAKDELADAINENMKIDSESSGKGSDEDEHKGRFESGYYHARGDAQDDAQGHQHDHHSKGSDHQAQSDNKPRLDSPTRISKGSDTDSESKYGDRQANWDWDKESNGAWAKKSDDGSKQDYGKFEKYHQKFADHEHANKGDELDEISGQNEEKSDDQHYGKKLGGWAKTGKSGDHHFQSGHNKKTSHDNKFDANDSWKGWD